MISDQASSVFTSTKDVGDAEGGIPVFAGQATLTDEVTGRLVAPQIQLLSKTQTLQSFIAALGDSLDTSGLAALTTASNNKDGSDSQKTGSLNITLNFISD